MDTTTPKYTLSRSVLEKYCSKYESSPTHNYYGVSEYYNGQRVEYSNSTPINNPNLIYRPANPFSINSSRSI